MEWQHVLTLLFGWLISAAAAVFVLSSLAGFLGRRWWIFDLFNHFRVQYFIGLAILAILFAAGGRFIATFVCAATAVFNLILLLPPYLQSPSSENSQRTYRLFSANVLQQNERYDLAIAAIEEANPDLIVLVEVNQKWMEALKSIRQKYPYAPSFLREDNYGIALFSRYPLLSSNVYNFCDVDIPTVTGTFEVDGEALTLVGTHPPPPKSSRQAHLRNQQLAAMGRWASQQSGLLILAGDMNASPWTPFFKDLIRKSKLKDSRNGFGIQPSWPVRMPFLRVPIDQVLVSPAVNVHLGRLGPITGSDHLPVIVDFSLSSRDGSEA